MRKLGLFYPCEACQSGRGRKVWTCLAERTKVTQIPAALIIIQIGRDSDHYEIILANAMSFDDFQDLLNRIVLVPV